MANNNKHTGPNVPALRFPEFSGEWEQCQIKDFGKVITGSTPPTSKTEYYDNGEFLWASPADLGNVKDVVSTKTKLSQQGFNKCRKIPAHSILVTCIGSTIGKMGMATTEMATNQQINSIIPIDCSPDYVYYSIQSRFPKYITSIATQAVPILSKSVFESLDSYKTSIEEQNKIGKLLHLLDERIDAQSKIIEEQETLLKSLADRLFSQNNHSCQLSKLVDIVKGKQLNADTLSEVGDYYVMNGGITPSGYYSEYNVPAGAISISEGGNSCGYVQFNEKPFWSGGHCYSLQCRTNLVDYKYIYYYLKTKEADVMALRIGSGLPNIQKKDIEKFTISYPSLQSQKQFVKALDALSEKINTEKHLLEKYCQQKSYLLSQMFI